MIHSSDLTLHQQIKWKVIITIIIIDTCIGKTRTYNESKQYDETFYKLRCSVVSLKNLNSKSMLLLIRGENEKIKMSFDRSWLTI